MKDPIIVNIQNRNHQDTPKILAWLKKKYHVTGVVALRINWRGDYIADLEGRVHSKAGHVGHLTGAYSLMHGGPAGTQDRCYVEWCDNCPVMEDGSNPTEAARLTKEADELEAECKRLGIH